MTDNDTPKTAKRPPLKRRRQRMLVVSLLLPALGLAALLSLVALQNTTVYFYAPKDLPTAAEVGERTIRIGGMVAEGSLRQGAGTEVMFDVTDYVGTVTVSYNDLLPGLFRDNQGVVVQGTVQQDGTFLASKVMAKHDENYMPPEVAAALKESGRYEEYMEKGKVEMPPKDAGSE